MEPIARTRAFDLDRESIDPDDFTGGFALWSGTSFAAPTMAGRIAAKMLPYLPPKGKPESRTEKVERGWKAVAQAAKISPR
jgi:hypothetical protein